MTDKRTGLVYGNIPPHHSMANIGDLFHDYRTGDYYVFVGIKNHPGGWMAVGKEHGLGHTVEIKETLADGFTSNEWILWVGYDRNWGEIAQEDRMFEKLPKNWWFP